MKSIRVLFSFLLVVFVFSLAACVRNTQPPEEPNPSDTPQHRAFYGPFEGEYSYDPTPPPRADGIDRGN